MTCYSWWIVPHNYPKIMRDLGMSHIPHLTIKKGMTYPTHHDLIGVEIPLEYGNVFNDSRGWGIKCSASNMGNYTMTIDYVHPIPTVNSNYEWPCAGIFCCANTCSHRPRNWYIITERM